MQIDTPPRVRFDLGANEEQPFDPTTPPQLIVASSARPRIATSESIANRVKRRRETPPSFGQSIAENVLPNGGESPLALSLTKILARCSNIVYCSMIHNTRQFGAKRVQINLAG
jgi:hypothetical protein